MPFHCPQIKLANVDAYTSPSDGVWHPDQLALRLSWSGSGHAADSPAGWLDPFASLPSRLVVEGFTEQLPSSAAALQWAMPQYGSGAATAADRGNLALARQVGAS